MMTDLINCIVAQINNKDYAGARSAAIELTRSPSTSVTGHILLGHIYSANGKIAEATLEYNKVLHGNPFNWVCHVSLANMYAASSRWGKHDKQQALFHASIAVKERSGDWRSYATMAAALARSGFFSAAAVMESKAMAMAPPSRQSARALILEKYFLEKRLRRLKLEPIDSNETFPALAEGP